MQALEPLQSAFPEDKESLFESSHCIFDGEMLRNDGFDLNGPRSGGGVQSITFDDFASSFASTPSSSTESYSYQPATKHATTHDEMLMTSPMDTLSSSSRSSISSASFNAHDRQASWDLSLDTRRNTLDSISSFNSAAPSTISSSNSEWSFDELLPSSLLGGLGLDTTPMGQWKQQGRSLPAQDNNIKKMEVDVAPFPQKMESTVNQPTILDTKFTVSTPMSMYTDEMEVLRDLLESKSHMAPQQSTNTSFDRQEACTHGHADISQAPASTTLPTPLPSSYPFTSSDAAVPPHALSSSSSQSFVDFVPPPQPALSSVPLPSVPLPPTTSNSSLLSLSQLQVDPLLSTPPVSTSMPQSLGLSLVPASQQPLSNLTPNSSNNNDAASLLSKRRNALPSCDDEKTLQAIALANSILSHQTQTEKSSSMPSSKPLKPPMFGRLRKEAFFDTILSPKSVLAPRESQGHSSKQQDAVKAEEEEYRPDAEPVSNNSLYDVLAQWQFAGDRAAEHQQQGDKEMEMSRKRKGESEQGPVKVPKAGRGKGRSRMASSSSTCCSPSCSSSSSSSDDDDDEISALVVAQKSKKGRRKSEKVERRDSIIKEEMRQALEKRRFSSGGNASKASLKKYKDGFSITDNIVLADPTGIEKDEVRYPTDESLWELAHGAAGPLSMADSQTTTGGDGNGNGSEEEDQKREPTITERQVGSSPEEQMDLYTPRWSRGNYPAREGWCHLCEHGGWYSMKRSQYLYHLQYDHGVSSTTKRVYEAPQAMRVWNDAVQSIELRCGHCNLWIPLSFGPSRKRSFKVWFKHAHACHLRKS